MSIKRYFTKVYWFKVYWKQKLARYIIKEYQPWDQTYLMEYLILKFTFMGLYFVKFGICEESKKQAHDCWMMRKHIKEYQSFRDKADAMKEALFLKEFGFPYAPTYDLVSYTDGMGQKISTIHVDYHIPEGSIVTEDGISAFIRKNNDLDYDIGQKALDNFAKVFVSSVRGLWD